MPVGFMPDFGALRDGHFEVVICTGATTKTIIVDESGQPVSSEQEAPTKHAGAYKCAFSVTAFKALEAATVVLPALLVSHARERIVIPVQQTVRPEAVGSVLGSRGPPVHLV